jgi:hypothetical protein
MSIVRRSDGALLFFNAVPVPEDTLQAIRALGRPAQLIVPNAFHAIDAAAFAQKLDVTPYAPAVAIPLLAARLTCRPIGELPTDDAQRVFTVEGFRTKEVAVLAGDSLLVCDLVTNSPHGRGVVGLFMRLVGFTGTEPKLPKPVRTRVEVDVGAVKQLLTELAALPGLARIVPTHGAVIEADPAGVLLRIAAGLPSP